MPRAGAASPFAGAWRAASLSRAGGERAQLPRAATRRSEVLEAAVRRRAEFLVTKTGALDLAQRALPFRILTPGGFSGAGDGVSRNRSSSTSKVSVAFADGCRGPSSP